MSSDIGGGRPLRVCDLCGQVDDHPRHSIAGTVPGQGNFGPSSEEIGARVVRAVNAAPEDQRSRLLRDFYDTTTSDRHLDCCAAAGCPLPADDPLHCANRTRGAEGKTGKALLAHLTKGQ